MTMAANPEVLNQVRRQLADGLLRDNAPLVRELTVSIRLAASMAPDDSHLPEVRDMIASAWARLQVEMSYIP